MGNDGTRRVNYITTDVNVIPVNNLEKECMASGELKESDNIPELLDKHIRTSSEESCLYSMRSYLHLICNPNGRTIDVESVRIKKTNEVFIRGTGPGTGVQEVSDENISCGSPIFSVILRMYEDDFELYKSLIEREFGDGYSVRKTPA